jgi:hypothetical protein
MVDEIDNGNHHPMNLYHGDTIFIGLERPQEGLVNLNCDRAYKDTQLAKCCGI